MSDRYTEDALVEQPAIELFKELSWGAANCYNESFDSTLMRSAPSSFAPSPQPSPKGRGGINLGRETTAEVVLVSRLRPTLERLNPDAPREAIDEAIEQLTRDRRAMTPANANREIYMLLKNGVKVMRNAPSPLVPLPKGEGDMPMKSSGFELLIGTILRTTISFLRRNSGSGATCTSGAPT